MAKRDKIQYICTECGYVSSKWNGCCPGCGTWNTLEEALPSETGAASGGTRPLTDLSSRIHTISDITSENEVRYSTGCGELDRVDRKSVV